MIISWYSSTTQWVQLLRVKIAGKKQIIDLGKWIVQVISTVQLLLHIVCEDKSRFLWQKPNYNLQYSHEMLFSRMSFYHFYHNRQDPREIKRPKITKNINILKDWVRWCQESVKTRLIGCKILFLLFFLR